MNCCDATIDAEGGCTGWTQGEPWPWHGCSKPPLKSDKARHVHVCKCGVEWGGIGGRPRKDKQ